MANQIWLKRVLIPLWTIQLLFCLILVGSTALVIAEFEYIAEQDGYPILLNTVVTAGAVLMSFTCLTILLTVVEIILMARHRLHPVTNIVFQCIKGAIWTAYLISTAIGTGELPSRYVSGLIYVLILFLSQLGLLVYGSVILHRHRKGTLYRGQYSRAEAGTAGPLTYNAGYNAPPFENPAAGVSYEGASSMMAGSPFRDTSRDPSPAPTVVPDLPQQHSYSSYKPYQSTQSYDQAYEMSTHPVAHPIGVQELGA